MEAQTVTPLASVASHDETVRCLLAIELSKKSWIIAVNSPLCTGSAATAGSL
jgi:transposase